MFFLLFVAVTEIIPRLKKHTNEDSKINLMGAKKFAKQTELTYEVKLRRRTVNALALEDDEGRDYLR